MASRRVCLALLLVVCVHTVASKPFLGFLWCEYVCDDYDDDDGTTTTSSDYDYGCGSCRPTRRTTTTTTASPTTAGTTGAVIPGANPSQFSVEIPPGTAGYIFTLLNNGNRWGITLMPKPGSDSQATTTSSTTVVTTTAGGATTAAGTTAGGTTAAATTAAPTTAAAK